MTTHTTTLEAREEIAEGTMAFHLGKPNGSEFKPGQAIDVVLFPQATTPDDQSTRHAFSMSVRLSRTTWSLPHACATASTSVH